MCAVLSSRENFSLSSGREGNCFKFYFFKPKFDPAYFDNMSNEEKAAVEPVDGENGEGVEETVSLDDVIREQEGLEESAKAVLGASDDKNCTYDKGYVKRQALYACLTCVPKTSPEPAGVCLACSLQCHDGHELIELYTKRDFRCDCGNGKFGTFACTFRPNKDQTNENNKYNHNFLGEYCTCNRPYPDPEDDTGDEMIQCIMCEDWFHTRHLGANVPSGDEYSEMICQSCVDRCPFLRSYGGLASQHTNENEAAETSESNGNGEKNLSCKYFNMSVAVTGKGAVFFTGGWRERLCRCAKCMEMYDVHGCQFLTDTTDTVEHYEEMGKLMHESGSYDSLENGMRAWSQQDRTTQIEMAHEYNEMKHELTNYLKTFAEKRKVVKEEDIYNFFNDLRARKRPRLSLVESCSSSDGGSSH